MESNTKNLSYIIAFAVINDKQDLINFLSSNAVIVKANVSDDELTSIAVNALSSSTKLQQNFLDWIALKTNKGYANSNGYFSNLPSFDTSVGVGGGSTSSSSSSGFWSGVDAGAVTGILSAGLNLFGGLTQSKEQRKALEAQAKAQIAQANAQANSDLTQLEIAKLQLQASLANKQTSGSSNTIVIVGVVVGLAILGTVVYFVTKKK